MTTRENDRELRSIEVRHACGHRVVWLLFLEETTEAEAREMLEARACLACGKAGKEER